MTEAERLEKIIRDIGARIGAYLDPIDVIHGKVVGHIQYAPRRDFPFIAPDGVRYESPGCTTYPKDHMYSKMSKLLGELSNESPELRERIGAATGMYHIGGGIAVSHPPT